MNVAGRAFVKGAYTPVFGQETMISARFAILNELAKQIETLMKK